MQFEVRFKKSSIRLTFLIQSTAQFQFDHFLNVFRTKMQTDQQRFGNGTANDPSLLLRKPDEKFPLGPAPLHRGIFQLPTYLPWTQIIEKHFS